MLTPSEMKDRMHELARTEGLIEGIYNYCDRWCERCAFTPKCLEENKPGAPSPEEIDLLPLENEKNSRFYSALEVVYFYNFFISAKIYRALSGAGDFDPEEVQTDSNGSAKIVLIALDRLIAAWSVMMGNMMDHEDDILKFLITMVEMRKLTEINFPLARKFVRSGFDDL
jgi:hypothetical protein